MNNGGFVEDARFEEKTRPVMAPLETAVRLTWFADP